MRVAYTSLLVACLAACQGEPSRVVVGTADTVVLNHRGPVRLPVRLLDDAGRELERRPLRVEPVRGTQLRLADDGSVTCLGHDDAVVRVSAGRATTLASVRCRPVAGIRLPPVRLRLALGGPPQALTFGAVAPDGAPVSLFVARLRAQDTTVVRLQRDSVVPRALGETWVDVEIGDCRAALLAEVVARVADPSTLRPHEEFMLSGLRLADGETRRWSVVPGLYELALESVGGASGGLLLRGTGFTCARFPGDPGQHYSCMAAPGAEVRVESHRTQRSHRPVGTLLIRRRVDPSVAGTGRTLPNTGHLSRAQRARMCGVVL